MDSSVLDTDFVARYLVSVHTCSMCAGKVYSCVRGRFMVLCMFIRLDLLFVWIMSSIFLIVLSYGERCVNISCYDNGVFVYVSGYVRLNFFPQ